MNDYLLIDIHAHIIPNVDDGPSTIEESIILLKEMVKNGISDVILTPHHQSIVTRVRLGEKYTKFNELKQLILKKEININIHLGHEIGYYSHLRPNYEELTLAKSNYILIEFDYDYNQDIEKVVNFITSLNLIPIISHVERYDYLKLKDIIYLKELGALIQVNAKQIYNPSSRRINKIVKRLLKHELIDFIASDCHNTRKRPNDLRQAHSFLYNRVDKSYVKDIFYNNAMLILNNAKKKVKVND